MHPVKSEITSNAFNLYQLGFRALNPLLVLFLSLVKRLSLVFIIPVVTLK